MPVFVKAHMRSGKRVKGYNRSNLAQANRYLSLSNRLTRSAMKRGVSKFSMKRLNQLDSTIKSLNRTGYQHVDMVMRKKANLQGMMRKQRYGLGYRMP